MAKKASKKTKEKPELVDEGLARPGGLSYLEIPATDGRKSAVFYAGVFRWNVSDLDTKEPKFMDPAGQLLGRWVSGRAVVRRPGLLPYIYVDRIKKAVGRVAELGGEVVKAPYRECNLWIATVRDPAGNLIGVWQDAGR